MTTPAIGPNCFYCKHIRQNYTCDAFPGGMPSAIVMGDPHLTPIEGDSGIVFELRHGNGQTPEFDSVEMEEY